MGRGINKKNVKTVMDALKDGRKTWTELKSLGIPERSLSRILTNYLEYWGLAFKDGQYWAWHVEKMDVESPVMEEFALEHSKLMIKRFNDNMNRYAILELLVFHHDKDSHEECLYSHLKTGYLECIEAVLFLIKDSYTIKSDLPYISIKINDDIKEPPADFSRKLCQRTG